MKIIDLLKNISNYCDLDEFKNRNLKIKEMDSISKSKDYINENCIITYDIVISLTKLLKENLHLFYEEFDKIFSRLIENINIKSFFENENYSTIRSSEIILIISIFTLLMNVVQHKLNIKNSKLLKNSIKSFFSKIIHLKRVYFNGKYDKFVLNEIDSFKKDYNNENKADIITTLIYFKGVLNILNENHFDEDRITYVIVCEYNDLFTSIVNANFLNRNNIYTLMLKIFKSNLEKDSCENLENDNLVNINGGYKNHIIQKNNEVFISLFSFYDKILNYNNNNLFVIIEEFIELMIVSDDFLFEAILKLNDIANTILLNSILNFIILINNNPITNKKNKLIIENEEYFSLNNYILRILQFSGKKYTDFSIEKSEKNEISIKQINSKDSKSNINIKSLFGDSNAKSDISLNNDSLKIDDSKSKKNSENEKEKNTLKNSISNFFTNKIKRTSILMEKTINNYITKDHILGFNLENINKLRGEILIDSYEIGKYFELILPLLEFIFNVEESISSIEEYKNFECSSVKFIKFYFKKHQNKLNLKDKQVNLIESISGLLKKNIMNKDDEAIDNIDENTFIYKFNLFDEKNNSGNSTKPYKICVSIELLTVLTVIKDTLKSFILFKEKLDLDFQKDQIDLFLLNFNELYYTLTIISCKVILEELTNELDLKQLSYTKINDLNLSINIEEFNYHNMSLQSKYMTEIFSEYSSIVNIFRFKLNEIYSESLNEYMKEILLKIFKKMLYYEIIEGIKFSISNITKVRFFIN